MSDELFDLLVDFRQKKGDPEVSEALLKFLLSHKVADW